MRQEIACRSPYQMRIADSSVPRKAAPRDFPSVAVTRNGLVAGEAQAAVCCGPSGTIAGYDRQRWPVSRPLRGAGRLGTPRDGTSPTTIPDGPFLLPRYRTLGGILFIP